MSGWSAGGSRSPICPLYRQILPNGYKNTRRIKQAKVSLKGNREQSAVRGMSEWISEQTAFQMLSYLTSLKKSGGY